MALDQRWVEPSKSVHRKIGSCSYQTPIQVQSTVSFKHIQHLLAKEKGSKLGAFFFLFLTLVSKIKC